ncbi:MAG: hypothetical protein ACYDC1_13440 [Limisphaerales bacterium]
MKTQTLIPILSLSLGGLLLTGCGNSEAPTTTPPPAPPMTNAGMGTAGAMTGAAAEIKSAASQVAAGASQQAAAVETEAQTLIDKAKGLVTEKKYQEALGVLGGLGSLKLTPEQQKVVDDLKAQIQRLMTDSATKAATDGAAGAVGGLLDKKP